MQNLDIIISNEQVGYPYALEFMEERVAGIIDGSKKECLWILDHPALYTYGTSANQGDLLDKKFPVYEAGRGGEFTYHGPGQRVAYVMMNLEPKDVRHYVWSLEEWIIQTLAHFGINGERREGRIGIWVNTPLNPPYEGGDSVTPPPHRGRLGGVKTTEAKIAALGIRVRKWVSFHGISININPDLEHFDGIVPCGISNYGVTSMEDLGVDVDLAEFDDILIKKFHEVFNY